MHYSITLRCLLNVLLDVSFENVNVTIMRTSVEHAEKEKHRDSLCGQRMSKSKFAPGQQSMLLQQVRVKCAPVLASGGFVPSCRCCVN